MTRLLLQPLRGRIRVVAWLSNGRHPSLSVGSKKTKLADLSIDIDRRYKPDVVGSALFLPFRGGIFEEVMFTDVMEHLPRGSEFRSLTEINRVVGLRGKLVFSTPNRTKLFTTLYPALLSAGHRHYSISEVRHLLEVAGFRTLTLFTSGDMWAAIAIIWYFLFTYSTKRVLIHHSDYVPHFLTRKENDGYMHSWGSDGYTIFAEAEANTTRRETFCSLQSQTSK